MATKQQARRILQVLGTQEFFEFHEGVFQDYVEGADNRLTEEEILERISEMFVDLNV